MRLPSLNPSLPLVFLDTNIFLRHLRNDHPVWSPACRQVFVDIEQGKLDAWTSDLAIAEVVFLLESTKHYHQERPAIVEGLVPLILLPHLKLPMPKRRYRRLFALYTDYPKLSFIDCYNATLVAAKGTSPELYSYDTDFDLIRTDEGTAPLSRREPPAPRQEQAA